ncbi:uncharacterized protein LOC143147083 isoform X1 [Ptiloglossa arizonensis]|uniref:uncharacterized protein LOC143147083 isoform X1 n=1 Tax=Ptiloglossa arizonensis TaxID=3350558 RepID=UPI003F9EDF72
MTGRSTVKLTGVGLLGLLLSCIFCDDVLVAGNPIPIPSELLYSNNNNAENLEGFVLSQILLKELKQVIEERKDTVEREKVLEDEQMVIQSVLEDRAKAKARIHQGDYSVEELPTPNAIVSQAQRSGKRTALSYVTLCHFKICNMGRKRQLHK